MTVCGKPGKRKCCFPPFPQTLEIARKGHRKIKIMRSDFHIPSAPAASMNQFQNPKGQKPASPNLRCLQAHPSIGKDLGSGTRMNPPGNGGHWCNGLQFGNTGRAAAGFSLELIRK
jgi:hypothetical protein